MHRSISPKQHVIAILVVLHLIIAGSLSGLAQSSIHGENGPLLTFAGATMEQPGMLTVKGANFSPEGSVYLVLFDRDGAKLGASHWITPDAMYSDSAGNYAYTGVIHETLGGLCGPGAMTQAYDEATRKWSNIVFVERQSWECARGPHPLPA